MNNINNNLSDLEDSICALLRQIAVLQTENNELLKELVALNKPESVDIGPATVAEKAPEKEHQKTLGGLTAGEIFNRGFSYSRTSIPDTARF